MYILLIEFSALTNYNVMTWVHLFFFKITTVRLGKFSHCFSQFSKFSRLFSIVKKIKKDQHVLKSLLSEPHMNFNLFKAWHHISGPLSRIGKRLAGRWRRGLRALMRKLKIPPGCPSLVLLYSLKQSCPNTGSLVLITLTVCSFVLPNRKFIKVLNSEKYKFQFTRKKPQNR